MNKIQERTLKNLAQIAEKCAVNGDFAAEQSIRERILKIAEKSIGQSDPSLLLYINDLCECYRRNNDFGRAEAACQRVIDIVLAALGNEHPYLVAAYSSLGDCAMHTGNYSSAAAAYKRAADLGHLHYGYKNFLVEACLKDFRTATRAADAQTAITAEPVSLTS
jgi:tetratricopeptide (TPR) repeat protein